MSFNSLPDKDLSLIPLAVNPDGSPPNFSNPPSLVKATYGVGITAMIVTALAIILRFIWSFKQQAKLAVHDYFCFFGWALTSAYTVIVITMDETARHAWDVPISFINESWLKRLAAVCLIYGPAMLFAKVALFTLYLHYFGTLRWMRWACYSGIAVSVIMYGSAIPVFAIYSIPHGDEEWNFLFLRNSKSLDVYKIITASFNIAVDVYLLALPLPAILRLNLSLRKRVGLCAVFTTGIIGIIAAAIGLYYRDLSNRKKINDGTWSAQVTFIAVIVELYVSIFVSCIPSFVSSWKMLLRDSPLVSSLKSLLSWRGAGSQTSERRTETKSEPKKPSSSSSSSPSLGQGSEKLDLNRYGNARPPQISVYAAPGSCTSCHKGISKSVDFQQHQV